MTDVFLSYASEDREHAQQLALALEHAGFSVWWDRHIVIGEAYDQAIERELETARSVIVLWSANSVASEWVKNEAGVAAERGVLLPAMLEQVKLPLEFRRKQTADLSGWNANPDHPGFQGLLHAVSVAAGRETAGMPQAEIIRPLPAKRRSGKAAMSLAGLLVCGLALYAWMLLKEDSSSADIADRSASAAEATAAASEVETRDFPASTPVDRTPVADLVAGTYYGAVIADSQGSSRNGVTVTLSKVDAWTVRVTSDYARIQPMEITIDRIGDTVVQAGGNTAFYLRLDREPVDLQFSPVGDFNYAGVKVDDE